MSTDVKKLKSLRESVNWEIEQERYEFLSQIYPLISHWKDRVPNLRNTFQEDEIECLLSDSINYQSKYRRDDAGKQFIRFVVRSGYKNEPKVDKDGQPLLRYTTSVHLAVRSWLANDNDAAVRDLFEIYKRFDLNYIDEFGFTHFHVACRYGFDEIVEKFLNFGQNPNCFVQKTGDSPLYLALEHKHEKVVELLLRNGADPNLTNNKGYAPMHMECKKCNDNDNLVEILFKICDDIQQTLLVDVRDKFGCTPLQFALSGGRFKVAELLLRRGADPNLANENGSTPLHLICRSHHYDYAAEIFFKINDELQQTIHVDARDKLGRTPLQWAVSNFLPKTVDVLLDRGADLSSFVFPSENQFLEILEPLLDGIWLHPKLKLASSAFCVIGRLEKRGYELDRGDALEMMKFFDKFKLFDKSEEFEVLDENQNNHNEFRERAKKMMINSSLSLHDLIQLRPKQAEKLVTHTEYLEFARINKLWELPYYHNKACALNLSEKLSRGFFRRWALHYFLELIHYRLPILCCEMIIEHLMNKDLYHLCLAAAGRSS